LSACAPRSIFEEPGRIDFLLEFEHFGMNFSLAQSESCGTPFVMNLDDNRALRGI
jgi:hypothetical protein